MAKQSRAEASVELSRLASRLCVEYSVEYSVELVEARAQTKTILDPPAHCEL